MCTQEQKSINVGSLFAGVGGICDGFARAGCNVVWANELDENSRKTYLLNYPNTRLTDERDVRVLSAANLERVDIVTAGFPCQPFSQAGNARGFEDERGRLFFEVTRILNELEPTAYFLENVKALATHDGGRSFERIREEVGKSGYSFIPFILRASDYTSIPQGRERIYIVGFRGEGCVSYSQPVTENSYSDFLNAPLSSQFQIPTRYTKARKRVAEFLDASTVSPDDFYSKEDNKIHERVRLVATSPDVVYQYRRWFVRENKSNVCPTLTANMGLGGHNIPIVVDGGVPRRLTPKECFNLQGFRQSFRLPSDVAKVHLYRQCGNSVVVPLVERIAKEIVKVLNAN